MRGIDREALGLQCGDPGLNIRVAFERHPLPRPGRALAIDLERVARQDRMGLEDPRGIAGAQDGAQVMRLVYAVEQNPKIRLSTVERGLKTGQSAGSQNLSSPRARPLF